MSLFQQRLQMLSAPDSDRVLNNIVRGVEKESLRVTTDGKLALTPHPKALGSALAHPRITTDYSEALLEFITPPSSSTSAILKTLDDIHRFTYQHIGDELLWVDSMPCVLGRDEDIPVAYYGQSNIGRMKHDYRIGLGHRYGRLMQTIAGIHYNFSLPETFWQRLKEQEQPEQDLQTFKTERYFGLIRNFRRNFWLLLYLFGSAPAVCSSFVKGREHRLQPFNGDTHSQHMPYATSLRMGDLGYQSKAQESLFVCYNNLENYINALKPALTSAYPDYEDIGLHDASGNYKQLSTNLLQIENEFYSTIRPKRSTESGETPLGALWDKGIEYIEVRCVDLNPFEPVGISAEQIHFLDIFLVHCLLQDSPQTDADEYKDILTNQHRTVYFGRDPELTLLRNGEEHSAKTLRELLFEQLADVAKLMDHHQQSSDYTAAYQLFKQRLDDPSSIPSVRILEEMASTEQTYFRVALGHAQKQKEYFLSTPVAPELYEFYAEMAAKSLEKQQQIEQADTLGYDDFLHNYYQQYDFQVNA